MTDRRDHTAQLAGQDLVEALADGTSLVKQLRNPEVTLARAAATYLLYKRKRLTEDSERGYAAVLALLTKTHPGLLLADLEPPDGGLILEEFLATNWSDKAPRTYNKSLSIISDFVKWHVARGTLTRDPIAMIDKAKTRPTHRRTFADERMAAA